MKLPEVNELINLWPKSLPFLKEIVLTYFRKNDIPTYNVWFPDIEILLPEMLVTQKNIQVVLFGGFIERVFESGNWPDKKFTFWCLSSTVKKVMVDLLKFPHDSVSVIPRYELIPASPILRPLNMKSDLQIVYSGRLCSQKNIEMVLAFASIMQESIEAPVQVLLLGEWGNQPPKNRGRFVIESYQQHVENFQKQLSFKVMPKIVHGLSHDEWSSLIKPNSVLVNLSTYVHEDFGLAVAQAQRMGMPMILSKWGGHSDVRGKNVYWVDVSDIGESLTSPENVILKAQIVVDKLLSDGLNIAEHTHDVPVSFKSEFLNLQKINQIRLNAMDEHGYGLSLIGQGWMSLFADHKEGREFFKKYSVAFVGESK